jgi:metal-sulfur cluster biosynthetic enzyme
MLNDSTITAALRNVQDPELHRDIVSLEMVRRSASTGRPSH